MCNGSALCLNVFHSNDAGIHVKKQGEETVWGKEKNVRLSNSYGQNIKFDKMCCLSLIARTFNRKRRARVRALSSG